jgi:two-component system, chemotaxis family, CheB/CheR fusion protein
VVGLGASAGGLDACRKFLSELPAKTGMAFILVQHLDPTHESMMAELLQGHTSMTVRQAKDGMPIEPEHLYLIPPGTYLSTGSGALHLSEPDARHGARLPFDFLLNSMATEFGDRVIGVVLSGTGADGSRGLKAVNEKGGFVIAQDPKDAGYDGMPRSAIMAGVVDLVLPAARIAEALVEHSQRPAQTRSPKNPPPLGRTRIGYPRSSTFFARRPPMISAFTSAARCSVGSNGVWRWCPCRLPTWIGTWMSCEPTAASSTSWPTICSST